MSKRAGKTDKGIPALRIKNGKVVSSSKGKRKVLVEHYYRNEKEINTWADANVE